MSTGRKDIISKHLRGLLADYFAENYIVRDIERNFDDVGIEQKPDQRFQGGQRRTLIAGYYNALDFADPADARKFLGVAELVLKEGDRKHAMVLSRRLPWGAASPEPEHPMAKFLFELQRCGYEWRDGAIVALSSSARLADTKAYAEKFDLNHLGEHIQRIERSLEADPRQAIGSAKELVETVAKTILTKREIPYERGDSLLDLGKAVFKALKQVPDDIPDAAQGASTIKRTLSNLASLVQGVAELRGFYGTGHGQKGDVKGLRARHAKLAVGAAATLATYWIETDRETPESPLE